MRAEPLRSCDPLPKALGNPALGKGKEKGGVLFWQEALTPARAFPEAGRVILHSIPRGAGISCGSERLRHTQAPQQLPCGSGHKQNFPLPFPGPAPFPHMLSCLFPRCQSEIPPTSCAQPRAEEGEALLAGMEQRCLGAVSPLAAPLHCPRPAADTPPQTPFPEAQKTSHRDSVFPMHSNR